jgi:pimeloyl-ACP methyl ester carboxylesterase
MKEVKNFEPNWGIYWAVLAAFVLISGISHDVAGISIKDLALFSILPAVLIGYFIFIQNRLAISSDAIVQSFLLPLHPPKIIRFEQIEWVALEGRGFLRHSAIKAFHYIAIIKLKNGEVIKISLALLSPNREVKEYFRKLCGQMMQHDIKRSKLHDLHGFSRLAIEATLGMTDLVEAMHQNIARIPGITAPSEQHRTNGLTGLVYRSIRKITGLVGGGIDASLAQLSPLLGEGRPSFEREAILAALNGVLGDYMAATRNPLAISMRLRREGRPLELTTQAMTDAISELSGKIVVMVHGLCMSDLQWNWHGHDHGAVLACELGYTPVYLHYNSGQHISTNGRAFADLLEVLVKIWPLPVKELVIIGHSMGGLVSRSACHYGEIAGHRWLRKLHKLFFLGTPHHGAPLERGGNWVDIILGKTPYTEPLARIGKIRSAGITDLRYGSILDEHWQGRDRFAHSADIRSPVPLPEDVLCFAIAATTGKKVGDLRDRFLGDGLVQVDSALGRHEKSSLTLSFPMERQWVGYDMNHMELLNHPEVYKQIRRWLAC